MPDWRDTILHELPSDVSPITVVYDPDSLLREQTILDALRKRSFQLLEFEDSVQFRFAWESECRVKWDDRQALQVIILVPDTPCASRRLPFDVVTDARSVEFSLGQLFPQLDYSVVRGLDPSNYDALYDAVLSASPGCLGENATKEFILRHVFEIAPELIKTSVDLLRMLLRRHYVRHEVPELLDERLIAVLKERLSLVDWPVESLIRDRAVFLRFLQEHWTAHVSSDCHSGDQAFASQISGPVSLPFSHDDIRVYMDNYFTDGLLQPVAVASRERWVGSWEIIGVAVDPASDVERRAHKLALRLTDQVPGPDARPPTWFRFAYQWAKLNSIVLTQPAIRSQMEVDALRPKVESGFTAWLGRHYAGLASLPPNPPVMVHHVPRHAARYLDGATAKVALVVVDGLSVVQWMAIRDSIRSQDKTIVFEENATFAWLPTLTSVSRQAIFAGLPPLYFPDSLNSTDKEPAAWQKFWSQHGLQSRQVGYLKGLGQDNLEGVKELASSSHLRVVGLVVDTVDKIMHGMELGAAGMRAQVGQWSDEGYIARLLKLLLDKSYVPIIVSDHGNVEVQGCGHIAEGAVSEVRGQRVRVCSNCGLRDRLVDENPGVREGLHDGLPRDYWPIYPPIGSAFVREGDRIVTHGGDSVEEMIVPFVTVRSAEAIG